MVGKEYIKNQVPYKHKITFSVGLLLKTCSQALANVKSAHLTILSNQKR